MTENTVELSQKFNDVKISCGDAKMTKSSKPKGPSATKAKENSFKKMSKGKQARDTNADRGSSSGSGSSTNNNKNNNKIKNNKQNKKAFGNKPDHQQRNSSANKDSPSNIISNNHKNQNRNQPNRGNQNRNNHGSHNMNNSPHTPNNLHNRNNPHAHKNYNRNNSNNYYNGRGRGRGRQGRGGGRGRGRGHQQRQSSPHSFQGSPSQQFSQQQYQQQRRASPSNLQPQHGGGGYNLSPQQQHMAQMQQMQLMQMQMLQQQQQQAAAAMMQQRPVHYSIDVECVATGMGHNDREVAQIGIVDEMGNAIGNFFIKPEKEVTSYLTALTGITKESLENGMTFDEAMKEVRKVLPKDAVLVGQNIAKDVEWLKLKEGEDFARMVDLVGVFQVWNTQYSSYTKFSLAHVIKVLLGVDDETRIHDAVNDAWLSISAYNAYRQIEFHDPNRLLMLQQALLTTPMGHSFARRNPVYEGVCMGYKKACTCGQPFKF